MSRLKDLGFNNQLRLKRIMSNNSSIFKSTFGVIVINFLARAVVELFLSLLCAHQHIIKVGCDKMQERRFNSTTGNSAVWRVTKKEEYR